MRKLFIITLAAAAALSACQQSSKNSTTLTTAAHTTAVSTAAAANQAQSDTLKAYQAYLQLKDNLVQADVKGAQQSAEAVAVPLLSIEGCVQAADVARQIVAADNVKAQRKAFLQLSQDMIPLVKGIKNKPAPIYVAYCPMANAGKGGYWLSAQKEIQNPYYGAEMLECGEVKEEIK